MEKSKEAKSQVKHATLNVVEVCLHLPLGLEHSESIFFLLDQ